MAIKNSRPDAQPLRGLRLLIPRPLRSEDRLQARLAAQECRLHLLPVLTIEPLLATASEQHDFLAQLPCYQHIIFVSGNAVARAFAILATQGSSLPVGANIYAVGNSTAEGLSARGIAVITPALEANSEGLLALAQLAHVAGQRILICRGEGGREALQQSLAARGGLVTYANLYRRVPTTANNAAINGLLAANDLDLVVIHSGEILAALWAGLSESSRHCLRTVPLLVPSDRVAHQARELGCGSILIADSALPDSMVAAMVRWYTQP